MTGAGDATIGLAEVASQAHTPVGFAAVVELQAVETAGNFSNKPLRATIATRIALMQLRLAFSALHIRLTLPGVFV